MPAVRGDQPRRARAIFDATLTLLAEVGYSSLTVEGIAERSGVHKTTLYRWWRSKDDLLGAALVHAPLLDLNVPDTGTLTGDLEKVGEHALRLLTSPSTAPVIRAVMAASADNIVLRTQVQDFFSERLEREQAMIDRAVARGELPAEVDRVLLLDLLAGALWFRVMFRQQPIDDGFVPGVVRAVVRGLQ